MSLQESGEMYLETIYVLSKESSTVFAIDIGNHLGYSKPSVSRALGLLKEKGYIEKSETGGIKLTKDGKKIAKAMLVVVAMVLAYGFYCTSYTINVDDVFDSFWNGGRLIAAGRFTGYLIQAVTGFMTYSPFFTIFLS